MSIIVGFTPTPEGEAALEHAVVEARLHGYDLVVVNVSAQSDPPDDTFATEGEMREVRRTLDDAGVPYVIRQLVRGKDAAEEIVDLVAEYSAAFVVIGLRHRSPVGKLLLGSNSQRILLETPCPVVAVKVAS